MAVKPIIQIPNAILTTSCEKAEVGSEETKQIVQDLLDTLLSAKSPEGAGLAAPQIGFNKRVAVVRKFLKDPNNPEEIFSKEYILINPKITKMSDDTDMRFEGCLSIPNEYGKVERAKKVKITALNENGEKIKMKESGFMARVIQHEVDHLNGILFTSKAIGDTLTEEELDKLYEKK